MRDCGRVVELRLLPPCAHAIVQLKTETSRAWWQCEGCGTPFVPAMMTPSEPPRGVVDEGPGKEYLSVRELAERIPYSEGAIRNLMSQGKLQLEVHYVKPRGRVMFRWSAMQDWLNGRRGVR